MKAEPTVFTQQTSWDNHNPVSITVGRGCRQQLVDQLCGQKLLIVTSQRGRRQIGEDPLLAKVLSTCRIVWVDSITANPGVTQLQVEVDRLKQEEPYEAVLAFGGGSAMDAGKAINAALAEECRRYTLAELLARPELHATVQPAPLYSVPTTAGTGSEVTPFATIWHHEAKRKLSLSGRSVWPAKAFIDAALTDGLPVGATISTGLDAINQAAESIWNKNANPITLGYAQRALQLGFAALPTLARGEGGEQARDQMAEASLLAGLAISQTRTALCHSISYPITAYFGVPHGLACAFTMPAVLRHNLKAEDGRFAQLAHALTGTPELNKLVARFDELHESMDVRGRVIARVPNRQALIDLKEQMFTVGRADNNIAEVHDLTEILHQAWGSL